VYVVDVAQVGWKYTRREKREKGEWKKRRKKRNLIFFHFSSKVLVLEHQ